MSGAAETGFLPYARQLIEADDVEAVTRVLAGDWLTTGPAVTAFEAAFAERVGSRYALACSSGTAALHLTALALGLGEGETAVVPSMTFLATANAVRYVGAEVAFADVDPDTGLLDEGALEAALAAGGDGIKAVYPVHLNGQSADMARLGAIARARGLAVVEDACHALGAQDRTEAGGTVPVGSCRHADMAIFSTHAVKTIATGEGGVVVTNDAALDTRLRRYRNHGMVREPAAFEDRARAFDARGAANPWYYEMPEPGFNYRLTDLQCALGTSQLAKLDRFVARRRALADRYEEALAPLAPLVRPVARVPHCIPAWHLYAVRIDFTRARLDRAALMAALAAEGIGTQVHYIPVHSQPYYVRRYGVRTLPGAETYYDRTLSLPLYPAMAERDVDRVADALARHLGGG